MFLFKEITRCLLASSIILILHGIGSAQVLTDKHCSVHYSEPSDSFEFWLDHKKRGILFRDDEILTIPVVVHIIHNGEPMGEGSHLSDEQVFSQLRILNEDFRRKAGTLGFNDHPDGADARIEFVLARSDPNRQATNGILRVDRNSMESPAFGGSMIALGAFYSLWDPKRYLNIWAFPGFQDTGLGEARFPISDLAGLDGQNEFSIPGIDSLHGIPVGEIDGVAINSVHFGETDINSAYRLGRTGTHELGHFLGLFHIWGDQGFEGSCDIDDYCEDTPLVDRRTSGCPANRLACDGTRAMIENYMDYTDDACMNIFTQEQIQRMRTVLRNSPRRQSLLTSHGLLSPDELTAITPSPAPQLRIYPNPFIDEITIENLPESRGTPLMVSISTIQGQIIKKASFTGNARKIVLSIPPQNHQLLLLSLQADNYRFSCKIVARQ